jgi:hypothetical protein
MQLSEIKYPLRLVVEILYYCIWNNPKTNDVKLAEIKEHLLFFFTEEELDKARLILEGKDI